MQVTSARATPCELLECLLEVVLYSCEMHVVTHAHFVEQSSKECTLVEIGSSMLIASAEQGLYLVLLAKGSVNTYFAMHCRSDTQENLSLAVCSISYVLCSSLTVLC